MGVVHCRVTTLVDFNKAYMGFLSIEEAMENEDENAMIMKDTCVAKETRASDGINKANNETPMNETQI